MVYLLYDLVLLLAAMLLIPFYYFRGPRAGSFRQGTAERLGFYDSRKLAAIKAEKVFWLHAVSVGELRAAVPLVKALKKGYPEVELVVSYVTETGHEIAAGIPEIDHSVFFPYDLSWVVRKALAAISPVLIVILETEIWPNFTRHARRRKIPIVMVNGRISDHSFPRYRLARKLFSRTLQQFSLFCMQTDLDARRIKLMGAPEHLVKVSGNIKFDLDAAVPTVTELCSIRELFRLPEEELIWIAGSTHAGEEEIIISVYRRLLAAGQRLLLVLVPRHPERASSVGDVLQKEDFSFIRRSELEKKGMKPAVGSVLLVDTVGELQKLYAVADVVFVGGSLVPVGGHNILEASAVKKPVVFGPHMHNFKEISRLLLTAGGGVMVADKDELFNIMNRLLNNCSERLALGERGYRQITEHAGATAFTLRSIQQVLAKREEL
ncbi:MAG: 3-deoxy-D-manno-octulosonic acid transferase [Pseudomonadota bacterium]|nr:3-deoxy-D-manno-octulosonic acid transferase [Pseudomonadota bacterium]MEA3240119.1 3-deoxy-D-manno-octulosonic acid transferase [Pseudomonadota bacterium]